MIWNLIGSIGGKVLDIVDDVVEDKDEANRLKFQIQRQLIENKSSELESAAKIDLAEVQGSWLQRNYRPHVVDRGRLCLELGAVGLLEFEGSVEQFGASARYTSVWFCSAGESCPSSFHQMVVPLPRANRSEFNDQVVVGFSRPLELVGADGCQSRDHGRTARSFQLFLYGAPKIPSAPTKADDQRANHTHR